MNMSHPIHDHDRCFIWGFCTMVSIIKFKRLNLSNGRMAPLRLLNGAVIFVSKDVTLMLEIY